jgi:hypothetical protein
MRCPYREGPGRYTRNDDDEIITTGDGPALLDVVAADDGYLATTCLMIPTP